MSSSAAAQYISDVSPHCGYQLNIHNYVASSVKTLVAASLWHGFPRELVGDHERMMSCGRFSLVTISALNSFKSVHAYANNSIQHSNPSVTMPVLQPGSDLC